MRIAREDVMISTCPADLVNTSLDYTLFNFAFSSVNLTFFYGCPIGEPLFSSNPILDYCDSVVYALPGALGPGTCNSSVVYPVEQMGMGLGVGVGLNYTGLGQILRQGFDVRWKVDGESACIECDKSGGRCGYDFIRNKTACFCPFPPYVTTTCSVGNGIGGGGGSSASVALPPGTIFF